MFVNGTMLVLLGAFLLQKAVRTAFVGTCLDSYVPLGVEKHPLGCGLWFTM
jgi:hypothetical protein